MSKGSRFGKSIGDALLEAMVNKHDSGQDESTPLSKKQKQKLQNEIITTYKSQQSQTQVKPTNSSSAETIKSKIPSLKRPSQAPPILGKLFYNALKRSTSEIYEEFIRPSTTFTKRKGMIEGVTHSYYFLQKEGDRSTSSLQKILEYQDLLAILKDELQKGIQTTKTFSKRKPTPLQINATPTVKSKEIAFTTKTQFDDYSVGNDLIDVIVGFDFGTACTKIVIRTPYERDLAYLLPFGKFAHSSNKYLLPTHISAVNECYCFPETGVVGHYDNLKLELIRSLTTCEEGNIAEYNSIAYLALVFQYVRNWFLRNCRANYSSNRLAWKVNIGVPSSTAEDDDVCQLYEKAVIIAWTLSTKEQNITAKGVDEVKSLYQSDEITKDEIVDVKVFPEVAAEVIGYTQSDMRQEGLHLMMDVGAGTLDICGFNVYQNNGENVLPIFSTNVEPYGVKSLHLIRCEAISTAVEDCHKRLVQDVVAPMSHKLEDYFPQANDFQQGVAGAEEKLRKRCLAQLRSVILDLKKRHVPSSERWKSQLPLFFCGGGNKLPFYEEIITWMTNWMKSNENNDGIRVVALPRPEALADFVTEENFHRFGVAWGLSHSPYDIDRVITNITPVYSNNRAEEGLGCWWEHPISYTLQDD